MKFKLAKKVTKQIGYLLDGDFFRFEGNDDVYVMCYDDDNKNDHYICNLSRPTVLKRVDDEISKWNVVLVKPVKQVLFVDEIDTESEDS